ncbi:MAG: hypothetical protein HC923_01695 [Myxococcales bacterium]|nr:hypothetical protein [Myxococcales bacterium]
MRALIGAAALFCLWACDDASAPTGMLVLSAKDGLLDVTPYAGLLADPERALSIEDVADGSASSAFEPLLDCMPNLGQSAGAYWVKVRLHTPEAPSPFVFFSVDWPRLEDVRIYWREGSGFASYTSGWRMPFQDRAVASPMHAFRVPVDPKGSTEVWVRVQSRSELIFPMSVAWPERFSERSRQMGLFSGLIWGMIAALTFFNLLVYLRLRRAYQLHYVLCVATFTASWALNGGYYGAFGRMSTSSIPIPELLISASIFFRIWFTREFLKLASVAPRWNVALSITQWIFVPLAVLFGVGATFLGDDSPGLPGVDTLIFLMLVLAGIRAARVGRPARRPSLRRRR